MRHLKTFESFKINEEQNLLKKLVGPIERSLDDLIDKYGKPLIDRIRKAVGLGSTKTSKGLQEAIKDFLPEVQLILRKELGEDVGGSLSRLINDKNISVIEGNWVIQSKRTGSYLKMQDLLTFVNAYKKGTMTADQIEMYLPNYTIDGKEFRKPFMDILKSIRVNVPKFKTVPGEVFTSAWKVQGANYDEKLTKKFFENIKDVMLSKVESLKNKSFNPKECFVEQVSEDSGRTLVDIILPNGEKVIMYKSTGKAQKTLPPPGGWSIIPGFIEKAKVWSGGEYKYVDLWFGKDDVTIGLTHTNINGNGTNKYLSELAQFLEKNSFSGLMSK